MKFNRHDGTITLEPHEIRARYDAGRDTVTVSLTIEFSRTAIGELLADADALHAIGLAYVQNGAEALALADKLEAES